MRISTAGILIFLTVAVTLSECQKWSDYNNVVKNGNIGKNSQYQQDSESSEKAVPAKSQQRPTVKRGIGSWGIIWITLTIIFTGVGVYYFILFYPIVCKKERMYDVMEMTTV